MAQASKIATCCYCGTRAALVLRGDTRHELSCSNCGAPLHDLKIMPTPARDAAPAHFSHPIRTPKSKGKYAAKSRADSAKKPKKKYPKKRKSRAKDWLEDVFDVIEDIFD